MFFKIKEYKKIKCVFLDYWRKKQVANLINMPVAETPSFKILYSVVSYDL